MGEIATLRRPCPPWVAHTREMTQEVIEYMDVNSLRRYMDYNRRKLENLWKDGEKSHPQLWRQMQTDPSSISYETLGQIHSENVHIANRLVILGYCDGKLKQQPLPPDYKWAPVLFVISLSA